VYADPPRTLADRGIERAAELGCRGVQLLSRTALPGLLRRVRGGCPLVAPFAQKVQISQFRESERMKSSPAIHRWGKRFAGRWRGPLKRTTETCRFILVIFQAVRFTDLKHFELQLIPAVELLGLLSFRPPSRTGEFGIFGLSYPRFLVFLFSNSRFISRQSRGLISKLTHYSESAFLIETSGLIVSECGRAPRRKEMAFKRPGLWHPTSEPLL